MGAILLLAEEYKSGENDDVYAIKQWKAAVVDGETIKADTWYKLVDGEFVECKE